MLGALEDDLEAVAFALLGHDRGYGLGRCLELDAVVYALAVELLEVSVDSELVDRLDRVGRNLETHSFTRLRDEETLGLEVGEETPLGFAVRV